MLPAKSHQPTVVQLRPFPTTVGSEEKTEKLWKRSPDNEVFCSINKCFLPAAVRHRRGLVGKRAKEHGKGVDREMDMFSAKTKRQNYQWAKPQEPQNLSLLAKKIHQDCCSETEYAVGSPISNLVDRDIPKESTAKFSIGEKVEVRDRDMAEWRTGTVTSISPLRVALLEWDQAFEWDLVRHQEGRRQKPLQERAQSLRWSRAHPWNGVSTKEDECECDSAPSVSTSIPGPPIASPAMQCSCGNKFQLDALFCSTCGRQRGCEVLNNNPMPAPKPQHLSSPRTPVLPNANPPLQRTASDFVSWLRRHRAAERTLPLPDFYGEGSSQSMGCRSEAAMATQGELNFCKTWSSRQAAARPASPISRRSGDHRFVDHDFRCTEGTSSLLSVRRMNRQHQQWQQLTVPILAENGEVITLSPMGQDSKGVWLQSTVPILGDNGEVIALRPAAGNGPMREWRPDTLPIFDGDGSIVALPSGNRCEWPSESVPIVTEKGEVVGIRPTTEHQHVWKQKDIPIFGVAGKVVAICPSIGGLKRWEKLTVPLLGDNGEVIYLDPPVDRHEMLSKVAHAEAPVTTTEPAECQLPCGSGSSDAWNRTNVPTALIKKIRKRSCSESAIGLVGPKSGDAPVVPVSARSPEMRQRRKRGHGQQGQLVFLTELDPGSSLGDESLLDCSVLSAPQTIKEKDSCNDAPGTRSSNSSHFKPLAIPTSPRSPACLASPATNRTSASLDSLASIREVIRIANDAKQATPDDHMLQVLQEALVLNRPGSAGSSVSSLLQIDAPETREISDRLDQLPELWRNTILKLLDEAESLQKTLD